ncbi:MAG: hypothetical protein L3I99_02745 [Sulfurimonas sp.]|nr:hypothetical protein [Sulfurimonas sp.]
MKHILILVFLFSFLHTDEIKRIELIVNDITELREQYKTCKDELNSENNNELFNNKLYKTEIKELRSQIKKYKQLLKSKDIEIKTLKTKKFDNSNEFPKLILKKEYLKHKAVETKASTYRLKTKSTIYDEINGNQIDVWDEEVSFTASAKAILKNENSWLKITGFFIDGAWVKAQSKMWVKAKYAKKR